MMVVIIYMKTFYIRMDESHLLLFLLDPMYQHHDLTKSIPRGTSDGGRFVSDYEVIKRVVWSVLLPMPESSSNGKKYYRFFRSILPTRI
jgi:hypothetical protein